MDIALVTGGAGYVGTLLVQHLYNLDYGVRILDNLMYNQRLPSCWFQTDNIEFVHGDVTNRSDVESAVTDVDYVVHLASIVGAPVCEKNPILSKEINYRGTKLLYDTIEPDTGFLFASTGSVYGKQDDVCTEASSIEPGSHYAKMKYRAEELLGDNAIIFRPATAFGLSDRHRVDLLINDLTYQATNNGVFLLWGENRMRTFIHVDDLARAFAHGIDNFEQMRGQTYNVGHEQLNFSKREICESICDITDATYTTASETPSDPDSRDYWVNYEKIQRTGYDITCTLSEGIQNMHEFYQSSVINFERKNQKLESI